MGRMDARAWLLFAAVSVLWGVPYLFIDMALDDGVGPLWVAAGRVLPAAAVLAPFALRRRGRALLRGRLGRLATLAVVEVVVPFSLIPTGERTVSSGLAGVLIATEPMFVLLAGLALGGAARPTSRALAGLGVGFAGVVVLLGVDGAGPGVVPIVVAAACYAVGAVLVGRWFADVPPIVVGGGMLAVAAPLLTGLALAAEPLPSPTRTGFAALAVLGLLCTAAGFVSFFALVGRAGAARAALITYAAPVVAVLCGVAFLRERVESRTVAGAALILVGAWLATRPAGESRPRRVRAARWRR